MASLSELYPQRKISEASPRTISGRTSYHQTRLAFHSLPQLIPRNWTTYGFGPPLAFLQASPWSWQARLASGLFPPIVIALLRLGFPTPTCHKHLDKIDKKNSLAPSAKGTPSLHKAALTLCKQNGFRVYFTVLIGLLFTFPSRYWFTIGH